MDDIVESHEEHEPVLRTVTMSTKSRGAQVLYALTAFLGTLVIVMGFTFVTRTADDATDQAHKNESLIKELQTQIETANAVSVKDQAQQAERDECVTRFTYSIQAASSELLAAVGDLVVIIATTVPGPEREASIGDGVNKVAASVETYRRTVQARIDFDVKGSPLPCPLKPGLTG